MKLNHYRQYIWNNLGLHFPHLPQFAFKTIYLHTYIIPIKNQNIIENTFSQKLEKLTHHSLHNIGRMFNQSKTIKFKILELNDEQYMQTFVVLNLPFILLRS